MAMSVLPKGPPLLVPQSTITRKNNAKGHAVFKMLWDPRKVTLIHTFIGDNRNSRDSRHNCKRKPPFQSLFTMVENMEGVAFSVTGQMRSRWECQLS